MTLGQCMRKIRPKRPQKEPKMVRPRIGNFVDFSPQTFIDIFRGPVCGCTKRTVQGPLTIPRYVRTFWGPFGPLGQLTSGQCSPAGAENLS